MELRNYEKVLMLDFVEDFKCNSCTLCCTSKWNINLSQEEYLDTEKKLASIGENIENYVDVIKNNGEEIIKTKFKNGNCSFLQGDKLCFLQKQFGWETLSDTCRVYPRKLTLTERGLEIGYSPSCPHLVPLFFNKGKTKIVEKSKKEVNYMQPHKYEFIEPRNAIKGSFYYNYLEFEKKAVEIFNSSKKLDEMIVELLELFNEYNKIDKPHKIEFKKAVIEKELTMFIRNLFKCSHISSGFSLEKANMELSKYIDASLLEHFDKDEIYLTEEVLKDVLKCWNKEDDVFLKKYAQNYIFKKLIFVGNKLAITGLIYQMIILKFYIALIAKGLNRKLTQEEKVNIIVEIVTSLAHNKILEKNVNEMFIKKYSGKPDDIILKLSTVFSDKF